MVAAERLVEKEKEFEQNIRHLHSTIEAQERQLALLDRQAAAGAKAEAEVEMLRRRERELAESVLASHETVERQAASLKQSEAVAAKLKGELAAAPLQRDQDAAAQEAVLLDKLLALRTEKDALAERAATAEAEVEEVRLLAEGARSRCNGMEAELKQLRKAVAAHDATVRCFPAAAQMLAGAEPIDRAWGPQAAAMLEAHAGVRHSRSVIESITSLCSAVLAGEAPDLSVLIGAGVGETGDDAASIRAARAGAGQSLEPEALATELSGCLEGLHAESKALLEALQDDAASRMGSSCATQ